MTSLNLRKKIGFYTVRTGISELGNELVVVSFLEDDNTIYSKGYVSSSRVKKHFDEIVESISYHHKNRYPWSYKTLNPRFYITNLVSDGEDCDACIFTYNSCGSKEMLGRHDKSLVVAVKLFVNNELKAGSYGIRATAKDGGIMCYKAMLKAFNLRKKGSKLTAI